MNKAKRESIVVVAIGILLFALDWIVKLIAERSLTLGALPIPSPIPFISWYLSYNQGYHYIFGQMDAYRWIAAGSLVLAAGLAVYLIRWTRQMERGAPARKLVLIMATLLIGALSNPVEILVRGHATDFFRVTGFPWTANLCDQYVNLIVYVLTPILLIMLLKGWDRPRKTQPCQEEHAAQ
jgi:lipoprotein signal peptidase